MNVQDVGKRCPYCTGLIGYQHDEWCPREEKFAQRDQYIDDSARYSLRDAENDNIRFRRDVGFYRGSAPAHQLFAQTQARVEAYRARPLEDRFTDMLTAQDRQLLSGMKIALN